MKERFRFSMRHRQIIENDQNVVVRCGPNIAEYILGNVPSPDWIDFTEHVDGLVSLELSWSAINNGNSSSSSQNLTGSNYDKGISLSLDFSGEAFTFIWDWLLAEPCQILNCIEVLIEDLICDRQYRVFEIKQDNISYCFNDGCQLNIQLREQDLTWHCIHKTFIWDDHQNWFNSDGNSTKEHPTFLTCIEPRPRLLSSVRMGLHIFLRGLKTLSLGILGFLIDEDDDDGREILQVHYFQPAPLVRDYIDNVASKCGLNVDTIFHDPNSPYHNICLYHSSNGQFYEEKSGGNSQNKYLFDNRWNVTMPELLDYLRVIFEAEWYVTPDDTIVFKPRFELERLPAIYDFTTGDIYIDDLCYDFSGQKKAAYGRYEYSPDGSDLASQEIANLYNDIVDYDGPATNPMLEGERSKVAQFASTGFTRDGRVKDYMEQLVVDGQIAAYVLYAILIIIGFALGFGTPFTIGVVAVLSAAIALIIATIQTVSSRYKDDIANNPRYHGAVRLTSEQTMQPRLLLWDGQDINFAKVVRTQSPTPNTLFNPDSESYGSLNKINEDNPNGYIYNYPMYFDSKFEQNLYDQFHDEVDNPFRTSESNQSFSFLTDLCCEIIDLLGLWDGNHVQIGRLVVLERRENYIVYGRIEDVRVNYENNSVEVQGKVIIR